MTIGRDLTPEELCGMPEELNDVPLERCVDNVFEPEEIDGLFDVEVDLNGVKTVEQIDVSHYIDHGNGFGHPFIARPIANNKLQLLGSNDILASARKQNIGALTIVLVKARTDEQWFMMSRFAKKLTIERLLWFFNKEQELGMDAGLRPEERHLASRVSRLLNLAAINMHVLKVVYGNNPKHPKLTKGLEAKEAAHKDRLFLNEKTGETEYNY
jgi:hypothetical protein